MSGIFISYRREDSIDFAGRLYDKLAQHFDHDQIFMDIDTIEPGLDFVEVIEEAVGSCNVLIAVIGKQWLTIADAAGQRRLDNPNDFVRLEIKTALERNIRVIPALIRGAPMPQSRDLPADLKKLSRRNAIVISDRFHPEVDRLIKVVEKVLSAPLSAPAAKAAIEKKPKRSAPPAPSKQKIITPARQDFEPELILIPAGEFLMGSDPKKDKDAQDIERPQHTVYLPDYYIAKTPVTNAQYAAFVEATGHELRGHWNEKWHPSGEQDHPVVKVSWHDAVAYCQWLTEKSFQTCRLPTEAEWEKAARSTDGRIYPWGNQWDKRLCNTREGGKNEPTPVGAYPDGASPYGVLDIAGNVWEWCATQWGESYPYNVEKDEWSEGYLESSGDRVVRGGSWRDLQLSARCAFRGRFYSMDGYFNCGFRLVSLI
jgi:formylglycine-generating enzyme required for sulfatase activity